MPSFSSFLLPGRLLNTVTALLAILNFVISTGIIVEIKYARENWIIVHVTLMALSAIVLRKILGYDPRKPLPDEFWLAYERKFCIFLHILEEIVIYLWLWSTKLPKLDYQIMIENIAMFVLLIFHYLVFNWFFYKELKQENKKQITFAIGTNFVFLVVKTLIIFTVLEKITNQGFLDLIMFFYYCSYPVFTQFIFSTFSGIFRESVRQLPVQVHAGQVVIVLNSQEPNSELERTPSSECESV
jgi:hypothetical protein